MSNIQGMALVRKNICVNAILSHLCLTFLHCHVIHLWHTSCLSCSTMLGSVGRGGGKERWLMRKKVDWLKNFFLHLTPICFASQRITFTRASFEAWFCGQGELDKPCQPSPRTWFCDQKDRKSGNHCPKQPVSSSSPAAV